MQKLVALAQKGKEVRGIAIRVKKSSCRERQFQMMIYKSRWLQVYLLQATKTIRAQIAERFPPREGGMAHEDGSPRVLRCLNARSTVHTRFHYLHTRWPSTVLMGRALRRRCSKFHVDNVSTRDLEPSWHLQEECHLSGPARLVCRRSARFRPSLTGGD